MRNGARRIVTIAAVIAVALLSGSAILIVRHFTRESSNRSFAVLLEQIDSDISGGYFRKSETAINRNLNTVKGEYNLLRLLKRAYRIAALSGDYTHLSGMAEKVRRKIPGSDPIMRIALYASLRADEDTTIGKKSTGIAEQYLVAEASLRRLVKLKAEMQWAPEVQELLALNREASPEQLQAVAARRDDARIMLDAALQWMKTGNPQNALTALRGLKADPLLREPRIMIAYDAGQPEEAAALLEEDPVLAGRADLRLVRADILRMLGREREAANQYQQAISQEPAFFWSPYLNLSDILAAQGQEEGADELRFRAYSLFPDDETVAIAYAADLEARGDHLSALGVLERLLDEHPGSVTARLALLELERESRSPQRYQGMLWQLFNEHSESPALCKALVSHLLGYGDLNGAKAALSQFRAEAEEQNSPWLLELQGLVEALQGRYDTAALLLEESLQRERSWRVRFNLAMVLAADARGQGAIEQLMTAGNEIEDSKSAEMHSRVRSQLGRLLAESGNFSAARRESVYALELNPANSQALLILRMLEGK